MAGKTLTNASNLLDLIDRAPASVLRVFSGRPACQALGRGLTGRRMNRLCPVCCWSTSGTCAAISANPPLASLLVTPR
ncbi:hypothetical protein HF908_01515 [Ralstonia pseudosolanacearum]|uniref:hypothetical protein n=1 Tax=Ralstonia pseudosolanacearum TaxID=1310165 RepID=UPI001866E1CF|nr:hypothetical protein [Ralstonia pseudosolanacearum]QOK90297.1 hypothetical protein HF908_01515 [Ralstonia pseudosolanacearum]